MAEKMPSSVRVGARPINVRIRSYSSGLSPCSAASAGVTSGWLGSIDVGSAQGAIRLLGGAIEVLRKPLEEPAPIGGAQRRFHVIFRVRHHAEHVAACVDDTRNRVGGAVDVPFRCGGAVWRRVAEHHAAFALEPCNG